MERSQVYIMEPLLKTEILKIWHNCDKLNFSGGTLYQLDIKTTKLRKPSSTETLGEAFVDALYHGLQDFFTNQTKKRNEGIEELKAPGLITEEDFRIVLQTSHEVKQIQIILTSKKKTYCYLSDLFFDQRWEEMFESDLPKDVTKILNRFESFVEPGGDLDINGKLLFSSGEKYLMEYRHALILNPPRTFIHTRYNGLNKYYTPEKYRMLEEAFQEELRTAKRINKRSNDQLIMKTTLPPAKVRIQNGCRRDDQNIFKVESNIGCIR